MGPKLYLLCGVIVVCLVIIYGGLLSHGGNPKSSKSLDYFSIETSGDRGIPHDLRTPPGLASQNSQTIFQDEFTRFSVLAGMEQPHQ